MDEKTLTFLYELLMGREERLRLAEIRENPRDETTRNEYVDFLLEQGRDASAELMRKSPWLPVGVAPMTAEDIVELRRELEGQYRNNINPPQIIHYADRDADILDPNGMRFPLSQDMRFMSGYMTTFVPGHISREEQP